MADSIFAPIQNKIKTPSFRATANNDPFGLNAGTQTPAPAPFQPQGGSMQTGAVAAFGTNGASSGMNAPLNPAATPAAAATPFQNPLGAPAFDITKTPVFQAQQAATMQNLDPNAPLPGFDAGANIARDAQKVAQMNAAKATRDKLMGQGLKDSGQYLSEGIIGPADKQVRDQAELERSLAATREQMLQARQAQGMQGAAQMTSALQQQQAQNFQLLNLGVNMQENDKQRVFQTQQLQLQQAFQEKGMNFDAIMNSLKDLPPEQAADIMNTVAVNAGIQHQVYNADGTPSVGPDGKPVMAAGLQNYNSINAGKALPVLNAFKPGAKIDAAQEQALVAGWTGLQQTTHPNIVKDADLQTAQASPEDVKANWANSNRGKLINSNGKIYEIVGEEKGTKTTKVGQLMGLVDKDWKGAQGSSGGITARDVVTGQTVVLDNSGNAIRQAA
jgi:hypothetical protein